MYARIIKRMDWSEIEYEFARIFGQRTKGGLTSVYYRLRKLWGLEDVLRSGASSYEAEKRVVDRRALGFRADFLISIGYLQGQ